jgi:hypothetical protein
MTDKPLPDPLDFANARCDQLSRDLFRARWHLAQVIPDDWFQHERMREAVAVLGGPKWLARYRRMACP